MKVTVLLDTDNIDVMFVCMTNEFVDFEITR